MTDKVQKLHEKIELVVNRRLNLINGDYFDLSKETDGFTNELMDVINSMHEDHVSKSSDESLSEFSKQSPRCYLPRLSRTVIK